MTTTNAPAPEEMEHVEQNEPSEIHSDIQKTPSVYMCPISPLPGIVSFIGTSIGGELVEERWC